MVFHFIPSSFLILKQKAWLTPRFLFCCQLIKQIKFVIMESGKRQQQTFTYGNCGEYSHIVSQIVEVDSGKKQIL